MSQGYLIYLNDMHGKPFRESSLNQTREVVSSVEYVYNAMEEGGKMRLDPNSVPVVSETGKQNTGVVGREVEVFVDLREQETASTNKTYNLGVDVVPTVLFPFPFPHIPKSQSNDYKLFRSASLLKTVHDYAVLKETIKTVNGSSIRSTNLFFDQETGEVIVSKTENEFEDPVFTTQIPAYYSHAGMGMAYRTLGMVIPGFQTAQDGSITASMGAVLREGDELVDLQTGKRTWVIRSGPPGGTVKLRLIDAGGRIEKGYNGNVKVCRSGYRNVLGNVGASFVTLTNPLSASNGTFSDFFSGLQIEKYPMIDAKATLYDEAWGRPAECDTRSCPEGYSLAPDGVTCVRAASLSPFPHTLRNGDLFGTYGSSGATVTDFNGTVHNMAAQGYWAAGANSPLGKSGIWSNLATGAPSSWGIEFCVDINWTGSGPYPGYVYIGFGVDNAARLYLDGVLIKEFTGITGTNFSLWSIQAIPVSLGRHTFRIEAENLYQVSQPNPASVAMEVYATNNVQDLTSGNISVIQSKRIFQTRQLVGSSYINPYLLVGTQRTDQKWTCTNGGNLQLYCDGTPDCGRTKPGACPEGYLQSEDGQSCIPVPRTDNDTLLDLLPVQENTLYDQNGAVLIEDGFPNTTLASSYWGGPGYRNCSPDATVCGRLNDAGVRLRGGYRGSGTWVGNTNCFTIEDEGDYYIGYGGEKNLKIYINDELWQNAQVSPLTWTVRKKHLPAGRHTLRVEASAAAPYTVSPAPVWGIEIYRASRAELLSATLTNGPERTFRSGIRGLPTSHVVRNTFIKSGDGQITKARYMCGPLLKDPCSEECEAVPKTPVLNPYYTGFLGNWSLWKEYVYLDSRDDNKVFDHAQAGLNLRQSSFFTVKTPFYSYDGAAGYNPRQHNGAIPGWAVSREATMQDRNGQELESKDALGRYTSARFGFRNTLPVAVAANARHREIFYDGFEDYRFYEHCLAKPVCDVGSFDIYKTHGSQALDSTDAHSGKYSLNLTSAILLNGWQFVGEHTPGIYLSNNRNGEYFRNTTPWLGLWGFSPVPAKTYILSAWVKDGNPLSTAPGVDIYLNQVPLDVTRKATVEGWKLVEVPLTFDVMNGGLEQFTLEITKSGGSTTLIDDIRIFPVDGQIKTYGYDERTLRLMAEMDENNYATFYEYDDEGSLTRVKKETERGIITIKESRTGYKRNDTQ
jgi:hypothetical protein